MAGFKLYFRFVRPYWPYILLTVAVGMVKFAIPLALPLMLKYVVDGLLMSDLPLEEKLGRLAALIAAASVLFVVIRGPVEYYRQYFAQWVTSRILYDIRGRLYEHIQKLSIRFYQNRKMGEIISRFINDVEQTKNLVETGMMNIWLDMFTLSIALAAMFYLNPVLTVAAGLVFPFYGIAAKILYKRLKALTKERSQALAEMQAYLHERIQGIPVIRSFTLEQYEKGRFDRQNRKYLDRAMAHTRWNALTFSVINTLTDIAPLLVIALGGYQVIMGHLTLGSFVAFFGYLERLYSPLRRLVNSSTVLTQAAASLERMVEFMQERYDIVDRPGARELGKAEGKIEFRGVWFRYHEGMDWVLKNINLVVEPGQTVALVGMSGGGKSSLVGLLPRFFEPEKGSVLVDGLDVREWTQASLRRNIGMVFQDNILFSGSVYENILLGNPEAREEDVIRAAKLANAHDFIMCLPQGYETEIGERGVKLSGGQKQRIAIARVFLKNPRILIFDEATSALDLEAEHLVQKSLEALAKERTTLIVAHRLSTITHADRIVLMEDGEIKEQGTHRELMEKNGIYARLFSVQKFDEKTGAAQKAPQERVRKLGHG